MREPIVIRIVHEPLKAVATPPATLANLCREDKLAVITLCAAILALIAQGWLEQRQIAAEAAARETAVAAAGNVVSIDHPPPLACCTLPGREWRLSHGMRFSCCVRGQRRLFLGSSNLTNLTLGIQDRARPEPEPETGAATD